MLATPTTPKGQRTRAHLLLAARRVFARDGFVNMRMSDVAKEANTSLGAVYRYFKDKEDLFENLIGDIHEELYEASHPREHRFATEPYAALLEANLGYLNHYHQHRDVMRALIEAAAVEPRFRDVWWRMRVRHRERFVNSLARDGSPHDPMLTRLAAEAMACMVEQAAYVWFAHDSLQDIEIPVDTAAAILTDGWYRMFFHDDGSRRVTATHPVADPQSN
ncbi:MAG: TetR/AcrR family transcriptional regulator [Nitrospiraceae bacterium]|nr:TetR/AcrR family transcriptional regulator [Nitrospiraceae bacterium]